MSDTKTETTVAAPGQDNTMAADAGAGSIVATTQTIQVPAGQRYAARVKWFDNKLNYGFATVLEGEHTGKDIFIHQSNILTLGQNVFRSLRMGEYIEFALVEIKDSEHKYHATAVTGPKACPLMCETNPYKPVRYVMVGGSRGRSRGRGVSRGRGSAGGRQARAYVETSE